MFLRVARRHHSESIWAAPLLSLVLIGIYVWLKLPLGPRDHGVAAAIRHWGTLAGPLSVSFSHSITAWLRLFTSLFLHADSAHVLGNMVFLLIFGIPAERTLGSLRLLTLFALGGAFANLVAALSMPDPAQLVIGASGAVSAVIGAYLALFPRARLGVVIPLGIFMEFIRAPASLLIGIWALLQVVFVYIGPAFGRTAWAAHIAGFCFGLAFAFLQRGAIARRLRRMQGY